MNEVRDFLGNAWNRSQQEWDQEEAKRLAIEREEEAKRLAIENEEKRKQQIAEEARRKEEKAKEEARLEEIKRLKRKKIFDGILVLIGTPIIMLFTAAGFWGLLGTFVFLGFGTELLKAFLGVNPWPEPIGNRFWWVWGITYIWYLYFAAAVMAKK